jgi:hypothetical protein
MMYWTDIVMIFLWVFAGYGIYHACIDIAAAVMTRARKQVNESQLKSLQNILDGKIKDVIDRPGFHPIAPGSYVMVPDGEEETPRPACYKTACPQNIADECVRALNTVCTWKEPA